MAAAYPNPASAITSIPMELRSGTSGSLVVYTLGAQVDVLHQGHFPAVARTTFARQPTGCRAYLIVFQTDEGEQWSHLMVK